MYASACCVHVHVYVLYTCIHMYSSQAPTTPHIPRVPEDKPARGAEELLSTSLSKAATITAPLPYKAEIHGVAQVEQELFEYSRAPVASTPKPVSTTTPQQVRVGNITIIGMALQFTGSIIVCRVWAILILSWCISRVSTLRLLRQVNWNCRRRQLRHQSHSQVLLNKYVCN